MDATDATLLRRFARDQDEDALRQLIARHSPWIHGVCRRILDDAHLADDAVQTVFIVLVQQAPRIVDRPLAAWLHRTASNTALKLARSESRRKRRERDPATEQYLRRSSAQSVDAESAAAAIKPQLDRALDRLSLAQREAVVRHYLLGESKADIARSLGCSSAAVQNRVAVGMKHLRRLLSRHSGVPVTASLLTAITLTSRTVASELAVQSCATAAVAGAGSSSIKLGVAGLLPVAWSKPLLLLAACSLATTTALLVDPEAQPEGAALESSWQQTQGQADDDYGHHLVVSDSSLYYCASTTGRFGTQQALGRDGAFEAVLVRCERSGKQLWSRQFGTGLPAGLAVDATDASFVAAGQRIFHFAPDGELRWERDLIIAQDLHRIYGLALARDGSGLYLACAIGQLGKRRACLVKCDHAGRTLWQRQLGRDVDLALNGRVCLAAHVDGGACLAVVDQPRQAGRRKHELLLARFDASGTRSWFDTVAGVRRLGDLQVDEDDGCIVNTNGSLFAYDAEGEQRWRGNGVGVNSFSGGDLAVSPAGIVLRGSTQDDHAALRAELVCYDAGTGVEQWRHTVQAIAAQHRPPFPGFFIGDLAVDAEGELLLLECLRSDELGAQIALTALRRP